MSTIPSARRNLSTPLLVLALAGAIAGMTVQLTRSPLRPLDWPLYDYVAFWAAGQLTRSGEDPYDPEKLQVLQRVADPNHGDTLVMWPAPWALSLLLPFSYLE